MSTSHQCICCACTMKPPQIERQHTPVDSREKKTPYGYEQNGSLRYITIIIQLEHTTHFISRRLMRARDKFQARNKTLFQAFQSFRNACQTVGQHFISNRLLTQHISQRPSRDANSRKKRALIAPSFKRLFSFLYNNNSSSLFSESSAITCT